MGLGVTQQNVTGLQEGRESFEAAKGMPPLLPGLEMHGLKIPGLWGEDVPIKGTVPSRSQKSKLGKKRKDIRALPPSYS